MLLEVHPSHFNGWEVRSAICSDDVSRLFCWKRSSLPLEDLIRKGIFCEYIYIYNYIILLIKPYLMSVPITSIREIYQFCHFRLYILPYRIICPQLSNLTSFCQVRHWHCRRRSMGETSDQSTPCLIHSLRIQSCCQSMVATGFLLRLWFARNDLELFGYGDFCPWSWDASSPTDDHWNCMISPTDEVSSKVLRLRPMIVFSRLMKV